MRGGRGINQVYRTNHYLGNDRYKENRPLLL